MFELDWVRKVVFVILAVTPLFVGAILKRDGKTNDIPPKVRLGKYVQIAAAAIIVLMFIADAYATNGVMSMYYLLFAISAAILVISLIVVCIFLPRFTLRK